MKLSARGRYALAATISMAARYESGENITVVSLSDRLGISKIYLEQVFSLLKKADIVSSRKGAQGGYRLTRPPQDITALQVLSATDLTLFETVGDTVKERVPEMEAALVSLFGTMDTSLRETLAGCTLQHLLDDTKKNSRDAAYMFYI